MAKSNSLVPQVIRDQFKVASARVLNQYAVADIQQMDRDSLRHLQTLLGHGSDWGIWRTPRGWFPGGFEAGWNAHVEDRIKDLLPEHLRQIAHQGLGSQPFLRLLIDDAMLSCTRYLVLCRVGPMSQVNWRDALDPSVVAQLAYSHLPMLAAASIGKAMASPHAHVVSGVDAADTDRRGTCFSRLAEGDVDAMPLAMSTKKSMKIELKRMYAALTRDLWWDAPQMVLDVTATTKVTGDAEPTEPEENRDPHQPLPDAYVGDLGQKSYWLIIHLGPNIVHLLSDFQGIWKDAALNELDVRTLSDRCRIHLASYAWKDADGRSIESLPFELRLSQRGAHSKRRPKGQGIEDPGLDAVDTGEEGDEDAQIAGSWPPRGAAQVFGLARALQGAHLFVAGLSTGARNAETLMMERACVQRAPDGTPYANGRTYKLVRRHDGELRDWHLPALAEQAFDQQAKLVSLMERLCRLSSGSTFRDPDTIPAGTGLWFSSRDRTDPATSGILQGVLRGYAETLGMEPKPGGQWIRPHRLRKTLARMVALAIVQAPKVLQDVFGHKSIEMTLYYILTDRDLAAEIDTIVRELRVMRCADLLAPIVAAEDEQELLSRINGSKDLNVQRPARHNYGGRAAEGVSRAVAARGRELHQHAQEWGADSIRELAEVLTLGGSTWNLVRPGVICTKSVGQSGPCNRKRGHADPGNCQSGCDYRLEEAWLREDVDQCIGESLDHWQQESQDGQDLVAEFWAGQIRMHVGRFPDLKAKWMQDQRVKALVEPIDTSEVGR